MKYLALDIGNVLCHVNQNLFTHHVSEKLNLSIVEVERHMKRFWELHDIGFTNIQDELIDKFNVKSEITMKYLLGAWNTVISPDPEAIKRIKHIVDDDVQIAFLSNMGFEHMKQMEHQLNPIYKDAIKHFSCEVGTRKPSKLFYQSFLIENPEFKGCYYVDDLYENLAAAKKFGFKPFHFDLKEHDYSKLSLLHNFYSI